MKKNNSIKSCILFAILFLAVFIIMRPVNVNAEPCADAGLDTWGKISMSGYADTDPNKKCMTNGFVSPLCGQVVSPLECCEAHFGVGNVIDAKYDPYTYRVYGTCNYCVGPRRRCGREFYYSNAYQCCKAPPPPPSCVITANPANILAGDSADVTVTWNTENLSNVNLNGSAVAEDGSQVFAGVSGATTYTLSGTDLSGNSFSCDTQVTIFTPPTGGLVPCGRLADNPDTLWIETEDCRICHTVPLIYNLINYLLVLVGVIAILMLVVTSFLSMTAVTDATQLERAKLSLNKIIQGFILVFVAWLIVNLVMTVFGFIDPFGDGSWKKFTCNF